MSSDQADAIANPGIYYVPVKNAKLIPALDTRHYSTAFNVNYVAGQIKHITRGDADLIAAIGRISLTDRKSSKYKYILYMFQAAVMVLVDLRKYDHVAKMFDGPESQNSFLCDVLSWDSNVWMSSSVLSCNKDMRDFLLAKLVNAGAVVSHDKAITTVPSDSLVSIIRATSEHRRLVTTLRIMYELRTSTQPSKLKDFMYQAGSYLDTDVVIPNVFYLASVYVDRDVGELCLEEALREHVEMGVQACAQLAILCTWHSSINPKVMAIVADMISKYSDYLYLLALYLITSKSVSQSSYPLCLAFRHHCEAMQLTQVYSAVMGFYNYNISDRIKVLKYLGDHCKPIGSLRNSFLMIAIADMGVREIPHDMQKVHNAAYTLLFKKDYPDFPDPYSDINAFMYQCYERAGYSGNDWFDSTFQVRQDQLRVTLQLRPLIPCAIVQCRGMITDLETKNTLRLDQALLQTLLSTTDVYWNFKK